MYDVWEYVRPAISWAPWWLCLSTDQICFTFKEGHLGTISATSFMIKTISLREEDVVVSYIGV